MPENQIWKKILSQTNIFNDFPLSVPYDTVAKILQSDCRQTTKKYVPVHLMCLNRILGGGLGGWGWSCANSKYQNTDDFFRKYCFTVRFFAKYRYRNTFSYFIVSLPRLARSSPPKSYQNK